MWSKSIGIIILLKIACIVSMREENKATASRMNNQDRIVDKEFTLITDKASWYAASQFCKDSGMQLASVNSHEEQQRLENLIRSDDIIDHPLWISKSIVALGRTTKLPNLSTSESTNQCISWFWLKAELCFALWPLENEWDHDNCNDEKMFICEEILENDKKLLRVIEEQLLTLVDELMFTGFADALSTTTEDTWISLVNGALQNWFEEQQQISKPASVIDEQVDLIAAEWLEMEKTFDIDELWQHTNMKFQTMNDEARVQLLSERFRWFVGKEYVNLGTGGKWNKSPSDVDITVIVEKLLMLAKVQQIKLASEDLSKFSESSTAEVLDDDFMKSISQQLLKFSENEFESYVMNIMAELEVLGIGEVDMHMLLQLYLLVKQELFSLIAKTVLKATSKERIEITSYGLNRILEGKQLIDDDSVFGQIFVMLGTGTAVLSEEKSVTNLDDVLLRKFVKEEFIELRHEDMLKLKYEGYIKFIIDEVIKLMGHINLARNDSGELLLKNVVDLIATQFLFYAEDELKTIAERLSTSIDGKSSKLLAIAEQMKFKLNMYDEDKLLDVIQLVQQELFAITVESLVNFTEKEMTALAEGALSKILAENMPKSSIFVRVFGGIEEELTKLTADEFAAMKDVELGSLVKTLFEEGNYQRSSELFEELYMNVIAKEFVKIIEGDAFKLSVHEQEKHQFGEIVRLLAGKLLEIANNESVYL